MEVVYLLVALAAILAMVIAWAFFWSVKTGQFDDLEGPAHRILTDNEHPLVGPTDNQSRQRGKSPHEGAK